MAEPRKVIGMNTTYAENQPEYMPLPVFRESDGKVTSVWELSDEEKEIIANNGMICLCQSTFNQLLQPVNIWVADIDQDSIERPEKPQTKSLSPEHANSLIRLLTWFKTLVKAGHMPQEEGRSDELTEEYCDELLEALGDKP